MKEKLFFIVLIFGMLIFTNVHAQEPQPITDSPIIDVPPSQVEDPSTPPIDEQRCEPVRPDELEGVSGDELIQRWKNYANCKGIELNSPLGKPCQLDNKIWFMSLQEIILSKGLDPDLEEYVSKVSKDYSIPVIIQIKCDISTNGLIELINLGQRYYRGSALQNNAYLIFIPAGNIKKIADKQYVEGLTLFKPSFKYDQVPSTAGLIETHVYSIEKTKPAHKSDLKGIGVDVLNYDDALKLYVVKMTSSQYDDVADLRWTKLITVTPESIPTSQLIKATIKADNYRVVDSKSQETGNSNLIYYIAGIILIIFIAILFLIKFRKR